MVVVNKYFLVIESEHPPQVFVDQVLPDIGTVIEIKKEQLPNRVSTAWLMDRFPYSRKYLVDKLRAFNQGDDNKHVYDPKEVIPVLENIKLLSEQRRTRRKH